MTRANSVWEGDWRGRVLGRLREMGFQSVTQFLSHFAGEPYTKVAERLGDDVAGLQVRWMQNAEARTDAATQRLAMDALARELNYQLPGGWGLGAGVDFHTSGAFVDWTVRLKREVSPDLEAKAKRVWDSLKRLDPPPGWSPSGPDDDIIIRAFSIGWCSGIDASGEE